MSAKLIIKSHHPVHQRLKLLGLALAVLGIAWGVFLFGQSSAGVDNTELLEERDLLRDRVSAVQDDNRLLHERLAVLERSAQVDRQAYGEVERTLKQAQDEMLELKQEVAFYRGIVSPGETASGLNIPRFELQNMGEAGIYRFKLVLTHLRANTRLVKGYVRLVFEGVREGKQTQLSLKDVSGGTMDLLKLRFRYFQDIEGDIVLPEGFLPSRAVVEVVPTDKDLDQFKKSFDWSDIISQ